MLGGLQVQERHAQPIQAPGAGSPDAVIQHEPPAGVSMSGGDNPTRLASHQAPRRAGSTSLCPPQLRRSGEKEIQTCAPESVTGRCSRQSCR